MMHKSQFRTIYPYDWFCVPGSHIVSQYILEKKVAQLHVWENQAEFKRQMSLAVVTRNTYICPYLCVFSQTEFCICKSLCVCLKVEFLFSKQIVFICKTLALFDEYRHIIRSIGTAQHSRLSTWAHLFICTSRGEEVSGPREGYAAGRTLQTSTTAAFRHGKLQLGQSSKHLLHPTEESKSWPVKTTGIIWFKENKTPVVSLYTQLSVPEQQKSLGQVCRRTITASWCHIDFGWRDQVKFRQRTQSRQSQKTRSTHTTGTVHAYKRYTVHTSTLILRF